MTMIITVIITIYHPLTTTTMGGSNGMFTGSQNSSRVCL